MDGGSCQSRRSAEADDCQLQSSYCPHFGGLACSLCFYVFLGTCQAHALVSVPSSPRPRPRTPVLPQEGPCTCLFCCRRLSALAGAAQAVQSAVTAVNTLSCGGDDQHGGPAQSALLQQAVATVPEKDSSAMQAIQAIEAALTYSQAPVKVWSSSLTAHQVTIPQCCNL